MSDHDHPGRHGASSGVIVEVHNHGLRDRRIEALVVMAEATQETLGALVVAAEENRQRLEDAVARIEAVSEQADEARRLLRRITRMENAEMVKLADIRAAVEANANVQAGVITLLQKLSTDLQSALDNGSDEELQAVIDQLNGNTAAMAAAVVANTPVANEQPPEPPAEEPAPVEPGPAPEPAPAPEPTPAEPVPADDGSETGGEVPVDVEPAPEPAPDAPAPEGGTFSGPRGRGRR